VCIRYSALYRILLSPNFFYYRLLVCFYRLAISLHTISQLVSKKIFTVYHFVFIANPLDFLPLQQLFLHLHTALPLYPHRLHTNTSLPQVQCLCSKLQKRNQSISLHLLQQIVPSPRIFRPHQLVTLVVDDAVTSAVYVPFQLTLPEALAGAFCIEDGNGVLTVFHSQPYVPQDVADACCLIAALRSREIRPIVLISANSGHGNRAM